MEGIKTKEKISSETRIDGIMFDLALGIGSSLNMYEMLRNTLSGYIRKLGCADGIVYQIRSGLNGSFIAENIFCIPYALFARGDFREPSALRTYFTSSDELKTYRSNLPLTGETDEGHLYYIMDLPGFGFLILVNRDRAFNDELLGKISMINEKLARASLNCELFDKLTEREKGYRQREELIGTNSGYWEWNIENGRTYFSDSLCRMLGYEQHEMEPDVSSWARLIHPEDERSVFEALDKHLKGELPLYQTEHRVRTKSGDWKWILDTGKVTSRDADGKPLRAAGTHVDISEKKQIEFINSLEQELSLKLSKAEDLESTLKVCLDTALEYSLMDAGGIYIENEQDESFSLVWHSGLSDEFIRLASHYSADSPNAVIIREGRPVYRLHSEIADSINTSKSENLKALAIIPIVYMNRTIGCFNMASRKMSEIPTITRTFLERIALHIGSFIVQAKNEERLRRYQQDLITTFNTIDDFLFILDMEARMIHFNSTVSKRLGYSNEELYNQNVLMVHPPEQHEEATRNVLGMLAGTETVCRVPLLARDGSKIPVETIVKPGKWGGKDAIIGVSRDTAQLQYYEKQIRENSDRLYMALMVNNTGLWDWNPVSDEVIFNEEWASLRGLKEAELKGKFSSWRDLIHPDDAESVIKTLNEHLAGNTEIYSAEYRSKTKNGNYIWIRDNGKVVERGPDNKPLRVIGTNIDITLLKENEAVRTQNLRQQELLSEIALRINAIDDFSQRMGIILEKVGRHTDVSRVYVFENSEDGTECNNTYEWCNEGIIPQIDELQNIPYSMVPSWRKMFEEYGRAYSEDISTLPEDLRLVLEPQGIKSIVVYPLYLMGEFYGFIGFDECTKNKKWPKTELEFLRTISGIIANAFERKKMEQSIINERDRANTANKAKSEFLANMSHEIRTPMNAILGFSEVLHSRLESEQHKQMLQSVLTSGNLLLSLINDILDLSKIEAGKLEINPEPLNFSSALDDIEQLFINKASRKGIRINRIKSSDFPAILLLDEIRIKQVLFNLVGNAVKFTQEGYVEINADFRKDPGSSDSGELRVEVTDTGIGIPESDHELIFEAFRQSTGGDTIKHDGVGLGLAISKRLIEKMNGKITLRSVVGKGTTFSLYIPDVKFRMPEEENPESEAENSEIIFSEAELLIVDDVLLNMETIEYMLADSALRITKATSGEQALESARANKPDVMLLDIRMPGMDGYELARAFRSDPQLSGVPLIAFTASVFSVEKLISSGLFDSYLIKPVNTSAIKTELARFLKHSIHRKGKIKQYIKAGTVLPSELPEGAKNNLKLFTYQFEKNIIPAWNEFGNQLILFKIEEFANLLKDLALQFNFRFIDDYAESINICLERLDLDGLTDKLKEFPLIIEQIRKLVTNIK